MSIIELIQRIESNSNVSQFISIEASVLQKDEAEILGFNYKGCEIVLKDWKRPLVIVQYKEN
jgi:hypothetical protein